LKRLSNTRLNPLELPPCIVWFLREKNKSSEFRSRRKFGDWQAEQHKFLPF
jgi:hypothetical protein